jgi:ATP/maltotriose-dependent transcriptional regulator MalT
MEPVRSDPHTALADGRWADARAGFEEALAAVETAESCFGLATALWWLGDNDACVERCTRAYALFRRDGDTVGAVRCAVWLAITYKANFANFTAANGWLRRAERVLAHVEPGPLHGWLSVARAYKAEDLDTAEQLSRRALDVARLAGDVDLELVALSQLGLILVAKGDATGGFALIDEATAAVLGGERTTLDTIVYVCCDMLSACELAGDVERATEWCRVADDFVARYGCPFLYAECRIFYGSVLVAKGRWDEGELELISGLQATDRGCPGLHARALIRLAGLRTRQGRLEEAEQLLAHVGGGLQVGSEEALAVAALLLARGDAPGAAQHLAPRLGLMEDQSHRAGALDVLVRASLATGDLDTADHAARRLGTLPRSTSVAGQEAMACAAAGRVALARGDVDTAATHLAAAVETWSSLGLPFEAAGARFDLGRAVAGHQPDLAVDHARRALATFESLGATVDADHVAAFLRSMGGSGRSGPKRVGPLTRREQEVLRLLGVGLTNPEIAARLHVSRKTAAHHVSSILAKLGLRNRAEAAAYAVGVLGTANGSAARCSGGAPQPTMRG